MGGRAAAIAIFALAPVAFGQRIVEFGAKIGIPATETFDTAAWGFLATGRYQGASATRRYTAGAGLGLRLPHGFGADCDVLYQRLGFDVNSMPTPIGIAMVHTWTTANSWEFPLMGKFRFSRHAAVTPWVGGGVSFRATSGVSSTSERIDVFRNVSRWTSQSDQHLDARSRFGGVVMAGVGAPAGFLRVSAEIRYTRWRADDLAATGGYFDVKSNPNQAELLLGITF